MPLLWPLTVYNKKCSCATSYDLQINNVCFDLEIYFIYLADSETVEVLWQMRTQRRQTEPDLPDTVTRLTTPEGSIVYLVGTAHFSDSSKKDVTTVSTDCLFLWTNIRSTD